MSQRGVVGESLVEIVDPYVWDRFVASGGGDRITQTSDWGRFKESRFEVVRYALVDDGEIVAGCQLLCGRVGPVAISYAPRGPLIASGRENSAHGLVAGLVDRLGGMGPGVMVLQPAVESREMAAALANNGFTPSPVDVTTPATVQIPLDDDEDEIFSRLRSSRRRNIRKAKKTGVAFRRGDRADLATFSQLHANTADRQGFEPMSLQYLERQWDELGSDQLSLYLVELDGVVLSGATVTTFGDRAVFKLAGLSEDPVARSSRASDYLHWRVMMAAKERGYAYYDLGGFDKEEAKRIAAGGEPSDEVRQSASQFKLGFGGDVVVLPDAQWRVFPSVLSRLQPPAATALQTVPPLARLLARFRD